MVRRTRRAVRFAGPRQLKPWATTLGCPPPNSSSRFNKLIATPTRGTLMGNRGVLHHGQGRIVKSYTHRVWVNCVLEFKGRHLQVMTPGRYTHLFFLDEATALAAGHRPCGECRRADNVRFKEAWATLQGLDAGTVKAGEMDRAFDSLAEVHAYPPLNFRGIYLPSSQPSQLSLSRAPRPVSFRVRCRHRQKLTAAPKPTTTIRIANR